MSVTRDLATVLTECKTSEQFHEFLVKYSLLTQQNAGLLASSEASLDTKTLPVLKRTLLCELTKKACEASTAAGHLQPVETNSPLNTSEQMQISEAWVKTHGFTIPSDAAGAVHHGG